MRPIATLLVVGLMTAAVLFVVGRLDTMRRSGTATPTIVRTRFLAADPYAQQPAGSQIEYVYAVAGATFTASDFRTWIDVAAHRPKVCFEPGHPENHLLVDGRIRCGVDPGP
jgi:hypothetical protein